MSKSQEVKRENGTENFLKEIMAENFSNLAELLKFSKRLTEPKNSVTQRKNKYKESQIWTYISHTPEKQR